MKSRNDVLRNLKKAGLMNSVSHSDIKEIPILNSYKSSKCKKVASTSDVCDVQFDTR